MTGPTSPEPTSPESTAKRAFVLGGGVAGITAAFRLLDRGYRVEMIEQRRWLGGRAFSVEDDRMGGLRDNGPHVMLGCYDVMRWMLRRIGTEDSFLQCPTLHLAYIERGGARFHLRLSRLPTPLAMPLAIMGLRGMGFGGKLRALRGFLSAVRRVPPSWSLEEWLVDRLQQGRRLAPARATHQRFQGRRRFVHRLMDLVHGLQVAVENRTPGFVQLQLSQKRSSRLGEHIGRGCRN